MELEDWESFEINVTINFINGLFDVLLWMKGIH